MGETIVLPKSVVVLERLDCRYEMYSPNYPVQFVFHLKALLSGDEFQACFASDWNNGTRDECIAWLDARVLETRAALTPPGHVLVGPDARETVARAVWEFNRVCEWTEATEEEKTDYLLGADAVLAALGVRGGA